MHVSPEHSHAFPKQKEQFNMATSAHLIISMITKGFYYKGDAIWDRGRWSGTPTSRLTCAPGSPAILTQHSRVLFFRKPGGRKGIGHYPQQSKEWKSQWLRSIWSHIQPTRHPNHPAVMPIAMARNLIAGWSLPNQNILDLFMGVGTTGCGAAIEGRHFIGIERDATYFAIAQERIAAARIQGSRAAAKERAAALPPPGAKKPFPPG
jgi:DNA modification methylase